MNDREFQLAVKESLVESWGDKSFPLAQVQRLWRIVKDLPANEFRQLLEQGAMQWNRPPSIAQIQSVCLPAINRVREEIRQHKLKNLGAPCDYCGHSGWLVAQRKGVPDVDMSFLCTHCQAASIRGLTTSRRALCWRAEFDREFDVCTASNYRDWL